jgi:hypothetical protein
VSDGTLFVLGGGVSLLVFGGIFVYAMYSFRAWTERDAARGEKA